MDQLIEPEVAVIDVKQTAEKLAKIFASRAAANDESDRFVDQNYLDLKDARLISAGVPMELGGSGASVRDLCEMLRIIAGACGSTGSRFRCIPIKSRYPLGVGTIRTWHALWLNRFYVVSWTRTLSC